MNDKQEYREYLNSKEWKIKRIQKATASDYTCEICHKKCLEEFEIHHKTYKHFMCEPLEDLMFLCKACHINVHSKWTPSPNKKTEPKLKKHCDNCYYSSIVRYGHGDGDVLYCNKQCCSCGGLCEFYRKGKLKTNYNKNYYNGLTSKDVRELKKKKKKNKKKFTNTKQKVRGK